MVPPERPLARLRPTLIKDVSAFRDLFAHEEVLAARLQSIRNELQKYGMCEATHLEKSCTMNAWLKKTGKRWGDGRVRAGTEAPYIIMPSGEIMAPQDHKKVLGSYRSSKKRRRSD